MLKMDNISKKYHNKVIFENVNIEINSPGIYWVKGKNGTGKSTIFNIIGDFITYKGKVINDYRNRIGYLFQNSYLIEYLTVREHLDLFKIDKNILEKFKLEDKLNLVVNLLSSGERQRLGFILAMYSDNELILLDEPFANLDENNCNLLLSVIKEVSKYKIILLISHDYKIKTKLIKGNIKIEDKKIFYRDREINSKRKISKLRKRKINYKLIKQNWKHHKGEYFKIYAFISIVYALLFVFTYGEKLISVKITEDINNSVDYNKFYLKNCSNIDSGGFKILKCNNPNDEDLKEIEYGYNYDYLLNYFYNKDNLSVMNNKNMNLNSGRYPVNENEVIASDQYNLGDIIELEVNVLIRNKKTDVYSKKVNVVVVGIYNKLNFYNDSKIYFDYASIDNYFNNEKLINNDITIKEYYMDLDINNYKYLSFNKINHDSVIFEGEKEDYYSSFNKLFNEFSNLVFYLKNILILFIIYNFYRGYKGILISNQKTIAFLVANSFNRFDILIKEILLFIIPIIIGFLVMGSIYFNLPFIIEGGLVLLCLLVISIISTFNFYSRNNIDKLMREEAW